MRGLKIYTLITALATTALFAAVYKTGAQTAPELIISWQAKTFAPAGYEGKFLPTRNSDVEAAVTLVDNGRIINLSRNEIRWFLNRRLEKSGIGLTDTKFTVSNIAVGDMALKAEIRDYKGQNIEQTVIVPSAEPEVVIDAPYPGNFLPAGANLFQALPYFFNIARISDLTFDWIANSQKTESAGDQPDVLELDTSTGRSGDRVNLSVTASSKSDPLEIANETVRLEIR